jgi:hypothetical protein
MKKITILFATVFFLILPSYSQTKTGVWKGEVTQNPDKVFYYEIRLDQMNNDGTFSGTTYIESYGETLSKKGDFGTFDITGTWNGNSVIIQELRVIKEERKSSNYYWCIKKAVLNYKEVNGEMVLEGPWTAPGGCVPGNIKVSKPMDKKPVITLDTLENRVVETKDQVTVISKTITIEVWDHNLIDGDIISLNLNGEWILESYTLQKEKKTITLNLSQGENTLILHAINLGTSPPNTASMNINDGTTIKTIVLNSDKGKSEAVKIIYQ